MAELLRLCDHDDPAAAFGAGARDFAALVVEYLRHPESDVEPSPRTRLLWEQTPLVAGALVLFVERVDASTPPGEDPWTSAAALLAAFLFPEGGGSDA